MPSKKKKYNARFPPARIKKIMQTDDEVGKVAAAVPVIISRALELFVESLITKANEITQARNAKTLTTLHLKQCILAENKFDFLKDLVASVPDVQVEDETSNSSLTPMHMLSGSINDDVSKLSSSKPRVSRGRKPKNNKNNNAGPSNSDDDEDDEETDEDVDDDDEGNSVEEENNNDDDEISNDKQRHLLRGPELIQANLDFKVNRPAVTSLNSDDEDYDS